MKHLLYALACTVAIIRIPSAVAGLAPGYDLRAYIAAARAVWLGLPFVGLTNAHLMSGPVPAYVYPPPLALMLVPVGFLPDDAALLTVRLLSVGGTIALIFALRPLVGMPTALLAVLCFPATWMSAYQGQVNALVASLICLAFLHPRRAGFWLALGGLLKITPLLLIRDRRSALLAGSVGLAVFLLSLPIVGPSSWLAALFPPHICDPGLIALRGALCRTPALLWLMTPLTIAVLLLSLRSPAALILAPLIAGPLVWPQSMVLALPALILMPRRIAILLWFALAILPGSLLLVPLVVGWASVSCGWRRGCSCRRRSG